MRKAIPDHRPARPRHASSLVLTRHRADTMEILMGRRPPRSSFIPDAFVFPGGRLDPPDARMSPSRPLQDRTLQSLQDRGACSPALALALANTAIRETFEETGLRLATTIMQPPKGTLSVAWQTFHQDQFAPDHEPLEFLGRAITPTASPIRFHARFFHAADAPVIGEIRSNGELLDLDWYPLKQALALPMIDVTQFILALIAERQSNPAQTGVPFFRYRRNKPLSQVRPFATLP